ncbi:MAG: hypothetical protein JXR80_04975 [Deltaproteobacteria bacterium]|nr:hypothetical protein [Deltaproteobacteria bacterium]
MRQSVPTSDIINDLLAENWQLRWQVLTIFYQTQIMLRDFARSSREYKQASALCSEMAGRLNGPSDVNLNLVLTAAWFLGGSSFLLLALEKIGVTDPETGDQETILLKKPLISNNSKISFFDYFHSLLRRNKAVDATTATAGRIFPPEICLTLLCAIAEAEPRRRGLALLRNHYPKVFFNELLLGDKLSLLQEKPELLDFIAPPLSSAAEIIITEMVSELLHADNPARDVAVAAAGRLKLEKCRPQLRKLLDISPFAAGALARLGDEEGCRKLLKAGKSWRRKIRTAVLADLAGCNDPAALDLLENRARQGSLDEKKEALAALGERRSPEALRTICALLKQTSRTDELNLLLQTLSGTPWPGESRAAANQLARLAENLELYPKLLQALAALEYGEEWGDILDKIKSPVLKPHYREIALFMTRFAEQPKIRQRLIALTRDIDWSFSYRLLNLLTPELKRTDIPQLLTLLDDREEGRALTIKERLTKGQDLERLPEALAEFFGIHPEIANLTIDRLLTAVICGNQPTSEELFAILARQPSGLSELLLGYPPGSDYKADAEQYFPLLMATHWLAQIEVDGSDCFAIVIHRTRRYSGFFRQSIIAALNLLLDRKNELDNFDCLPVLNRIIDFIRGRPHYEALREKLLLRITRITRNCRELKVYNEASQTRELRIFKVKKL